MNKIIVIISMVGLSFQAKSDTITFWHVYKNDTLIAELNELQDVVYTYKIKKEEIQEKDQIIVKYFRDTPCHKCKTYLFVFSKSKKLLANSEGKGTFDLRKFKFTKLLESDETEFHVYYFEDLHEGKFDPTLLFKIKID